jgi:1-acyl-sn-glycerol-3-phosphate acyltransferase
LSTSASLSDPGSGASGLLHFLSRARSYFLWTPLVFLYTGVFGIGSLISSLLDRDGRMQHRFAHWWSWMILHTLRLPVTITGGEKIGRGRRCVYAVNHISSLDVPLLYHSLPFQFRIMAKKELFHYPFLGWHLRRSGQIPVDPGNARASLRGLNRAIGDIKNGIPLVIFPEGGRSKDGRIRPFMNGPFYVAIKAAVDIVPVALIGTYEVLPMDTFHIKPRPLRVVIGDPISSAGYTLREMDKLAEKVRAAVESLYYSHSDVQPLVAEEVAR